MVQADCCLKAAMPDRRWTLFPPIGEEIAPLLLQDEMGPPIRFPSRLVVAWCEGPLLSITDDLDPLGVDPGGYKVVLCRLGAPLAKSEVVFPRPTLIAMALDDDRGGRICLQPLNVLVESLFHIRTNRPFVKVEENVLQG